MINKKRSNILDKRLVLIFALLIVFIIIGLVLNNKSIILINNSINQSIQKIQLIFFVTVAKIISNIFEAIGVILITLMSVIYLSLTKRKKESFIFAITVALSFISVTILKNIYSITRPLNSLISETDFSFPSGHSSIAVVLFGCNKKC